VALSNLLDIYSDQFLDLHFAVDQSQKVTFVATDVDQAVWLVLLYEVEDDLVALLL